jgi:AcrR family transcriptional regulator
VADSPSSQAGLPGRLPPAEDLPPAGELDDDDFLGGDRMHRVLVRELGPDVADVFIRMRRLQDEWELNGHPELGLRERKKRITRRRISDVATTLFVARGFENVTVANVADVVGVSEKTVYNYFPTKESLVFDSADETVEALATALRDSPPGEPPTKVMVRALKKDLGRFAAIPNEAAVFLPMFADMVEATPSLRAAWVDMYRRLIEVAARELAARAELDPRDPEVMIAARALVGLQEVSYASLIRNARAGVRGSELHDVALSDIERAARLLDTGLWSLDLLTQGFRTKEQVREAAKAADDVRRQVFTALRQARSTWAGLRRQLVDQAGPAAAADASRNRQTGRERHAERRAQHAALHAARRAAIDPPPDADADSGPDRPR